MEQDKLYFKNLDAIRFIAAFMVYLAHSIVPYLKLLPIQNTVWERLLLTLGNGGAGVSMFFVLSGFLITYLLLSEHDENAGINLKKFYLRRLLRIWPLYFFVIIYGFMIYPTVRMHLGMGNHFASDISYYVSFLSNFDELNIRQNFPGMDTICQAITWSVSIEEQFYLFWPLLFVLIPKRYWIHAMVSIFAGSLLFRLWHHADHLTLYYHTCSVLVDLVMGGMTAWLVKNSLRVRTFFKNTTTVWHLTFFAVAFILILASDKIFPFAAGIAISRIFIAASFALIIAAQAMTVNKSILALQNFSFISRNGKYTYGIYLLHPIALTVTDVAFRLGGLPATSFTNVLLIAAIGFALTMLMSTLSYHYFEAPFLQWKQKFGTVVLPNKRAVAPVQG